MIVKVQSGTGRSCQRAAEAKPPRKRRPRAGRALPIHNDFARWLKENRSRLPTRLIARRRFADGGREYRFPAAPDLRVLVGDCVFEVRVVHEGEVFDILVDFDVVPKKDAAGYYCEWCADAGRTERFADRATLLTEHTFEPFAAWCRETLRADKRLVLERYACGSTTARICDGQDAGDIKPTSASMYVVKPVLHATER